MALRQLLITKRISALTAQLDELKAKDAGFEERSKALKTREAELEAAVSELADDAPEDDRTAIDEMADEYEADKAALESEQSEHEVSKQRLADEIQRLTDELEELNKKAAEPPKAAEGRKGVNDQMETRMKFFGGISTEQRSAIFARDDVRQFVQRVREFVGEKRSVTGANLLIPDVMLGLLRDNVAEQSRLISRVNLKPVKGTARQNITGTIPEAVWTEMIGSLNELEIGFNQVEVDGFKVGGYVAVSNAILQDNDINLVGEVMTQIAKAIAKAIDKAIIYGTGVKQPLGIVTRLAQTSAPSDYPANAPAWVDLHTTNISKVNTTGAALIGSIVSAFGACKNDFSDGRKFFAMNSATYSYLVTTLLNFNAAGAIVTGMNAQMPILGGDIVILDFMPDYDIVGGYGDLYLLAEREGVTLESSEHVLFVQDGTVFKGVARYDGLPVIAKGFFLINIKNTDAATSATFAPDYANTELGVLGVTAAAGSASGDTVLTVTGKEASGTTLAYKIGDYTLKCGQTVTNYATLVSGTTQITAAAGKMITVVELNSDGRVIKIGKAASIPKA